ncbi:hypothetical protein ACF1A5_09045 [Streptomyces sp. NPDC014864]|uniref:hypothetical protein n=1 Tax=Streptomyces sp. NPDC014864 TaxID=3364924 RepID=UPI0036F875C3
MNDDTLFVESFDSVRTGESTATEAHLVQPQLEALASLLIGRRLAVPNTYAFDSASFLEFADVVLRSWQEHAPRLPAESRPGLDPFELRVWAPGVAESDVSLLSAAAAQLRRSSGEKRFVLSAWPEIDEQPAEREEMARVLDVLRRDDRLPPLPAFLRDGTAARRFDIFCSLHRAASGAKPCVVHPRGHTLDGYLTGFAALGDDALHTLARAAGASGELAHAVRHAVREQAGDGPDGPHESIRNRSWVHDPDNYAGGPIDLRVQEFVDTLYNAVLAASVEALDAYLSSPPRLGWETDLQQSNELALAYLRSRQGRKPQQRGALHGRLSRVRDAVRLPGQEQVGRSMSSILNAYFEHRTTDESLQVPWIQSCERLRFLTGIRAEPWVPEQLDDAWGRHLQLLRSMLTGAMPDDDPAAMAIEAVLDGSSQVYRLDQWPTALPPRGDGPQAPPGAEAATEPLATGHLHPTRATER